jgi:protease-4
VANENQTQGHEPNQRDSANGALEILARTAIEELRRTRRWNIFFRLSWLGLVMLIVLISMFADVGGKTPATGNFTAVVDLTGEIGPGRAASANNVISGLRDAFQSNAKAVILRANSPGGATVDSADINSEIRRLRKKYPNKPIYGVIVDVCASGCYYVISGTDRIYSNPSSIVGSIGVLLNGGFGFVDAMKKLGIQRRLFYAGKHKAAFDPYLPLQPSEKRHVQAMLNQVHQQFIDAVKQGRGKKLKHDPELFSGRFWSGATARKLGLVDEFGSTDYVAREVVGASRLVDFTYRQNWLDRFAGRIGASMAHVVTNELSGSLSGTR